MSTRALLAAFICFCLVCVGSSQPVYDIEGTVRIPSGRPSPTRLILTGPYQEQYATSARDNGQFILSVSASFVPGAAQSLGQLTPIHAAAAALRPLSLPVIRFVQPRCTRRTIRTRGTKHRLHLLTRPPTVAYTRSSYRQPSSDRCRHSPFPLPSVSPL